MVAADLDNDGDKDLLVSSVGNGVIAWCENTDGEGTFSAEEVIAVNVGVHEVCHAEPLETGRPLSREVHRAGDIRSKQF